MGIIDFDSVFDMLDQSQKGFVTCEQVQGYDEILHFTPLSLAQVRAAVHQVCGGSDGKVPRKHFVMVLQDLERRRMLEEQSRWDFMGLDSRGSGLLPLQQAFQLMQMAHGDQFSLHTWNSFIAARGDNAKSDVCFDEMRLWLCNLPGQASGGKAVVGEENKLHQQQTQREQDIFNSHKAAMDAENRQAKIQLEYEDKTKRLAQRKKNIWERDGVEAMLNDDGQDDGMEISSLPRDRIGTRELMDALDKKYNAIRSKLFWEMLKAGHGKEVWLSMTEYEQQEQHDQLVAKERQLRKNGTLKDDAVQLPGAKAMHPGTLSSLMGELGKAHTKQKKQIRERRMTLKGQKKEHAEIEATLKEEFGKNYECPCSYGDLVFALHMRQTEEKDMMVNLLRSKGKKKVAAGQAVTHYCRLVKEQHFLDTQQDMDLATMAAGLIERIPIYKPAGFDPDRYRQEKLCADIIIKHQTEDLELVTMETGDGVKDKNKTAVELSMEVVAEVYNKHLAEIQAMLSFLFSTEGYQVKVTAEAQAADQRETRTITLRNLRNAWRDNPAVYRAKHQDDHLELLQEGVGLYFANSKESMSTRSSQPSDDTVHTSIMADLAQRQALEFEATLMQCQNNNEEFLIEKKRSERAAQRDGGVLDNIAAVVLGTTQWTDDERPIVEALEKKYDALRQLIFMHILRLDYGIAWDRLTEVEKEKLLQKKKSEEEKLRKAGDLVEMSNLLAKLPEEISSVYSLLGEDKGQYLLRKKRQEEQQQQNAFMGKDIAVTLADETPASQTSSSNLLADLIKRSYAEQDALIGQLRTRDLNAQERLVPLVMLRLERRRALREEGTDVGMMAVGLLERVVDAATGGRHLTDKTRQQRLAQLRFEARRRREHLGKAYYEEQDDVPPEKGDHEEWMVSCLREIEKKHGEERETLLKVLQDPAIEDLLEAARMMTKADRQRRLMELQVKRRKLNMDDQDEQDENISILEEAAAIRVILKHELLQCEGREATLEEITVLLLTELQDMQDEEIGKVITKLTRLSEEDLKILREVEITSRHQGAALNVITVLTKYEGLCNDAEIIQALENKYEALKDKILLEALANQAGDDAWMSSSDADKQRQLLQIKLEAKKLHQEGKWDELAVLLGETVSKERSLRNITWMMGDNRFKYERKLREKLKNPNQDKESDGIEEEDLATLDDDITPFEVLDARKEEEKEALLALMKGLTNEFLSEKERQTELVRMSHGEKRAQRERDFESAAILVGLGERQQTVATESKKNRNNKKSSPVKYTPHLMLKSDRKRQERLATRRLDLLQKVDSSKKKKEKEVTDAISKVSRLQLQEIILERLDEKQAGERTLLVHMMAGRDAETRALAKDMTDTDRTEKCTELRDRRNKLQPEKVKDNHSVLAEATVYKMESRRDELDRQKKGGEKAENEEEEVEVAMMADLQELQDMEVEAYIQQMPEMIEQDLVQTQVKILYEKVHQRVECLAQLLLGKDIKSKGTEQEVIGALDRKYQLLRDRLFEDALKLKFGESSWKSESPVDQQKKLRELRQQEKKYREDENFTDGIALLGDLTVDSPLKILSMTVEDKANLKRDRAQRKKDRQADGFSAQEIRELEKDDEERERRSENVLQEMVMCYQAEKDHFKRSLQEESKTLLAAVHNALMYLNWELVRTQNEPTYDTSLLAVATARDPEYSGFDRELQERLASKRLQQYKISPTAPDPGVIPLPSDPTDLPELGQAVVREMEVKYWQERAELCKLLLNDGELQQYQSALQQMDADDRQKKREELRMRLLALEGKITNQQDWSLIKETVALALEFLGETFASEGRVSTTDDHHVALLANLQDMQDEEAHKLVKGMPKMDGATLLQLKALEATCREKKTCESLVRSLLAGLTGGTDEGKEDSEGEGEGSEAGLVQALEQKYDAIRDKLFAEALLREMGEAEWRNLSEAERQRLIMEKKLEEKRLRSQGRHEEAAALIGDLINDEEALRKLLGDTRLDQDRKMKERLRRKKALMKAREEEGLSTDDAVLEAILDQEDEERGEEERKGNLLDDIWRHFEDEKAALLAQLEAQVDHYEAEKQRQIAIAKIKRDKRRIQKEDMFEGCALLLSLSQQQEKVREANMAAEKERQLQLARSRLEARRQRGQQQQDVVEGDSKAVLAEINEQQGTEEERIARDTWNRHTQGIGALQESLLQDVESKQNKEREVLLALISSIDTDRDTQDLIANIEPQEIRFQLEKLRQERQRWLVTSQKAASAFQDQMAEMSQQEKTKYYTQVAKSRAEQTALLTKAAGLKMELERSSVIAREGGMSHSDAKKEAAAILLADLQQKQQAEIIGIHKLLGEQPEDMLQKLQETQRISLREGWMDNVVNAVFSLGSSHDDDNHDPLMESMDAGDGERPRIPDVDRLKGEMEKELEGEMEKKLEKYKEEMSEEDFEAAKNRLLAEKEAKVQAMFSSLEQQKKAAFQKFEARRQARDQKEYENSSILNLMRVSKREQSFIINDMKKEKGRQHQMMQQRIEARRLARLKEKEMRPTSASRPREGRVGSGQRRKSTPKELSSEQKDELYQQLVREQAARSRKLDMEQRRSEEQVKRRLEEMKKRRQGAATELLNMAERQKSTLEMAKKEDRDRQITMTKERLERLRHEKTRSIKEKGAKSTKKFDEMVNESEKADVTDLETGKSIPELRRTSVATGVQFSKGHRPIAAKRSLVPNPSPPPSTSMSIPSIPSTIDLQSPSTSSFKSDSTN